MKRASVVAVAALLFSLVGTAHAQVFSGFGGGIGGGSPFPIASPGFGPGFGFGGTNGFFGPQSTQPFVNQWASPTDMLFNSQQEHLGANLPASLAAINPYWHPEAQSDAINMLALTPASVSPIITPSYPDVDITNNYNWNQNYYPTHHHYPRVQFPRAQQQPIFRGPVGNAPGNGGVDPRQQPFANPIVQPNPVQFNVPNVNPAQLPPLGPQNMGPVNNPFGNGGLDPRI